MRAAWAQVVPGVAEGFDVVVIARVPVLSVGSRDAAAQMEVALRSLGVLGP